MLERLQDRARSVAELIHDRGILTSQLRAICHPQDSELVLDSAPVHCIPANPAAIASLVPGREVPLSTASADDWRLAELRGIGHVRQSQGVFDGALQLRHFERLEDHFDRVGRQPAFLLTDPVNGRTAHDDRDVLGG